MAYTHAIALGGLVHQLCEDAPVVAAGIVVVDVSAYPNVAEGWIVAPDGTVSAPVIAPPSPADLIAYANARQWALATGGFTLGIRGQTIRFSTAESALSLMDSKVMRLAQPNAPAVVNWQVGPAAFVQISVDDFVHAATLVADFVQATFDALPAIFAGIQAGTIGTMAAIDAAAWPAATGTLT
jgi:hypothetical protein